jgi:hypothetical protein
MIYSQQLMLTALINSKYHHASLKHSFYGKSLFNNPPFSHPLFQGAIRTYNKVLVCVFIMRRSCLLQTIFFHDIVSCRNTSAFKKSIFLNMTSRGLVYNYQFFGGVGCPHSQDGTRLDCNFHQHSSDNLRIHVPFI